MKRIIHIITGLTTGGAEMMLYKILSGHDSKLFSPVVISLGDHGTIGSQIEELGIPVHSFGIVRSGFPTPQILWKLASLVKNLQPHILQGWMYHGNLAATYAAFFCGFPPVCWNIRQSLYSIKYEKKKTAAIIRLGGLLGKLPKRIIFNAEEAMRLHEPFGFPMESSVVIPNGFDTELLHPDFAAAEKLRSDNGIASGRVVIGMIARYHPIKDHENLLRAAAIAIAKHPELEFVLIGKGVDQQNSSLLQVVARLGLDGSIHLLGERKDVPIITRGLDIATLSSYGEAFPNVIGEAMSCGVPCVVTDVGDSALIVGDTGRVVPPRDPQALANAWLELIELGTEKRRELGVRARQRICEKYSLQVVVKQYEALYENLITSKGRKI